MAATSEARSQWHGAVAVKNGNVLAVGVNRDKNHPAVMSESHIKPGACIHAEIDVLRRVANPRGSVIYVARRDRAGRPAYSRPCPNCEATLAAAGVKRVFHT